MGILKLYQVLEICRPKKWDKDWWTDCDEVEDFELLNLTGPHLPVETTSIPE